jgi:hypothetical protein
VENEDFFEIPEEEPQPQISINPLSLLASLAFGRPSNPMRISY